MNDKAVGARLDQAPVDEVCIDTLRTLAMDAVQQANSGHPGTPMALAPAAYVLWQRLLKHNPGNPEWFDRDRFVLSAGHASMLLYALLHLTGYDLPLEEIRRFRQWGSRTPGHPEHGLTPGVETTTGPLGQGLMNAVGMAIAEAHLAATFNRDGHIVVDHRTWVFASDGDLMEGASHEAASLAGHLGLGKLIVLYDDNHISIDGRTEMTYSDDVTGRFESYDWHVQNLGERANDIAALDAAFQLASNVVGRPSLIILRSHIAEGAPHARDTAAAHGSPLGNDEVRATKGAYGWPENAQFLVPERVKQHMGHARKRGAEAERGWRQGFDAYRRAHPDLASRFDRVLAGALPKDWDAELPHFTGEQSQMATRSAAGKVLNASAERLPELMGGAADLGLLDQGDAGNRRRLLRPSHSSGAQHPLGGAGTCDVCGQFGHGAAWGRASVRIDLSHLHRLRPARHSPGGADEAARHLPDDARLRRTRRRRSHPSADRTPGIAAGHAQSHRDPSRRCRRNHRGLAERRRAARWPDTAGADAAETAGLRPQPPGPRRGGSARRLHPFTGA